MNTVYDIKTRVLDERYIEEHQQKIFTAWKNVWKDTEWGEEEYFTFSDSIGYIRDLANHGTAISVEIGDQIISFIIFAVDYFPKPKSPEEASIYAEVHKRLTKPTYLYEFATAPEYRGKGIGSMMMDEMEQQVKKDGSDGLFAWTRKMSKSLSMYEKRGFTIVGELTVPKENKVGYEKRVYLLKTLVK
mgnify:CR=1 FL=1